MFICAFIIAVSRSLQKSMNFSYGMKRGSCLSNYINQRSFK